MHRMSLPAVALHDDDVGAEAACLGGRAARARERGMWRRGDDRGRDSFTPAGVIQLKSS